ncbi:TolC family outer membrane protein [Andreprevotia chitinilytica]|uniref:TolC family outer membrane protein n=1 Tax=Andreprevotia chitinilytica TaxID=396808 RepID=UPI0006903001|nr:TolC family outer membrane protein [Andreprevotia chitinilytica]
MLLLLASADVATAVDAAGSDVLPGLAPTMSTTKDLPGEKVEIAETVDLIASVQAARLYDAAFSASRSARGAGLEKKAQGLAGLLPQLSVSGSHTYSRQTEGDLVGKNKTTSYQFNLVQPIFDVAKLADYRRGEVGAMQAETEFAQAEQKLLLDVSSAYFDILLAGDKLRATKAARQAFATQLDQAKVALSIGEGTRTEVDEAQANLDQAQAREIATESDLELARFSYRKLTGVEPQRIAPIDWACLNISPSDSLANQLSRAATSNLNIRAAELQRQQAGADVTTARGAHLPVINAVASYSETNGPNSSIAIYLQQSGKTRNSNVGLNISFPLFAGGGDMSRLREALGRDDQATQLVENARRQTSLDVRSAFLNTTNGVALIRAMERAVASAQSKVESTRLGREVGVRTTIDLLNAEKGFYESQSELASARYTYLKARLQLAAGTNDLNEPQLAEINCQQKKEQ